ncbi:MULTISPECIES: hypothetical protein [Commensalibacter]|uniref:Lipoprotein n=1 Tax=Commensalibacter papalotli (ex Servin-Garciduenas et al. 2014) TaxID=1208583 RepID=W7DS44_9PROT|nr:MULTISPECIES: hypothetical protein [Commensalibacter]EUK17710.1 hypothetical protein COMX_09631 [Commensalibacter papalotli (ex Servin-Garciduenas et al. 2014)]CAI3954761.1 unnamed protein product [Commensalibacter papalotli (ex Botero et al. 2024)]
MINKIGQSLLGLSLCFMVSGCPSIYNSEYYIPVDNQVGDAQPLSKNDIIRVVIPSNFSQNLVKANSNNINKNDQMYIMDVVMYIALAKHETEKRLQNLGLNVINTGYHSGGNGHPTVIALVDSSPIEGSEESETHTWDAPVFTDDMGRTTLSEKQGVTINYKTYYYKVKLVRPEGKGNSLFECNSSNESRDYCIAPANPSNYQTIFTGYATLTTDNTTTGINVSHLTTAVFYNYPNMMGKKWV